ncbi:MAG: ABC transporter permease [Spirochaetae bacterium HGW-Spirochaetae-5]|nr:MAG: ABC transporter permease [Spirochaetae bacterium HGW-Spirochaetae-5]
MKPWNISVKNMIRRKGKSLFIISGMIIGTAALVAVITYSDAMTMSITHKMEKYGANIIITPKNDNLELSYGGIALGPVSYRVDEIRESDLKRIDSIKNRMNIAAVGPSVTGVADLNGRRVLLTGLNFDTIHILRPWWEVDGGEFEHGVIIAGSAAAVSLKIKTGDSVAVNGTRMKVKVILGQTGSHDDNMIFTDLKNAQLLLNKKGIVSMVEVAALCTGCPIEDMVVQLSDALPETSVTAIKQVISSRMESMKHIGTLVLGISIVLIVICGLVVTTTMMNSVRERSDEIGIFRAIGFRERDILQMILFEALVLSVIAGLAGYLLGFASAWSGAVYSGGEGIMIHFNPVTVLIAMSVTVATGFAAGIYPAVTASRLDPVEALRHI